MAIDVGAAATDRSDGLTGTNYTMFGLDNPVNADGTITSVEIWVEGGGADLTDLTVCIFYLVSGTTYKVRSSAYIGAVTKGSKQTFGSLSLAAETGDFIGCYYTTAAAWIEYDATGGAGVYYYAGECKDVNDQASFTLAADWSCPCTGQGPRRLPRILGESS